eukprot:404523_1
MSNDNATPSKMENKHINLQQNNAQQQSKQEQERNKFENEGIEKKMLEKERLEQPLFSNTSTTSNHNSVYSTQQLSVDTPTTVNALNANATPQYMPIYPTPIHTYTPYHNVNVNVNTNMNQL